MSSSINFIFDKKNPSVKITEFKLEKNVSKYSNTKIPIFKFIINETPISRNNSLIVSYNCKNCNSNSLITLNLFCRKMNKDIIKCNFCKNLDLEKRKIQSLFMIKKYKENIVKKEKEYKKNRDFLKVISDTNSEFEKEDDDFKDNYFKKYLTADEYLRIKNKIISIGNGKILNIEDFIYIPYYPTYNQTKYNPILFNSKEHIVEKPQYIEWICESCENKFTNRDLWIQKNRYKILCNECTFCNKTFKIRKFSLWNGNKILYQSNLELKLIKYCNEKKININNGPVINYIFNDKNRKYKVDFAIDDFKVWIETKDNHHWHKKNKESGIFYEKKKAAEEKAKLINFSYVVLFPNNWLNYLKQLAERYSLNSSES